MRVSCHAIFPLLLIIFATPLQAQTDPRLDLQEAIVKRWKDNIDELKSIASNDTRTLPSGEQAMYFALQAKVLWKTNGEDARSLLQKSGEKLVSSLEISDINEFNEHLKFFSTTFEILSELDATFARSTLGKIDKKFVDNITGQPKENSEMSDIYVAVALQIAGINPKLAASIGKRSFNYGFALSFPNLVSKLYAIDRIEAEQLFLVAVSNSRLSQNRASDTLLFNLCRILEFTEKKEFPTHLVRVAVRAFVDKLDDAAKISSQNVKPCAIAYFAPRLAQTAGEFYPELYATFLQNIETCTPFLPSTLQQHSKLNSIDENVPVDKLIEAARDAKDKLAKSLLYREAFRRLFQTKDFVRLLGLLDGLDGDDYKAISPVAWDDWRTSAASAYALISFDEGDLALTYRTIEKTPARLRPAVRMEVVSQISVAASSEFVLDNLNQMAKEVQGLDVPIVEAPTIYLFLVRSYARYLPTESTASFHQAVKAINRADKSNPDNVPENNWAPMSRYVKISADLLEIDDWSVFSSLNTLDSKRSRIRIVLGLLESSLPKYSEAVRVLEQLKKNSRDPRRKQ